MPSKRPLNAAETSLIRWFAEQLGEPGRQSLLSDLGNATAEEIDDLHVTIRFEIDGYLRPSLIVERPLPIDAAVVDADGAILSVVLVLDQNGRLLQLDVLRFESGQVLGPDWRTLRVRDPGEVIRLNKADEPLRVSATSVRIARVFAVLRRLITGTVD